MRRGAAWSAQRPSSCLVVPEAASRWQVTSPPSLHGLPSAAVAVQRNTVGVPARDRSAWWSRRSGCRRRLTPRQLCPRPRLASGVQCSVSGVSVQCPRVPVHATGVESPVRASERPGVRRPVSAVGVRCPCAPASAVSDRGEAVVDGGGVGSRVAGMAGIGVLARRVHDRLLVTPGEAAQAALGQGRRRLGPGRRCGRWWGGGEVDRVADQDRPHAREDRPLVGEPGCVAR